MKNPTKTKTIAIGLSLLLAGLAPSLVHAEDAIEKTGIGVGVTAGNILFLPFKAMSVSMGLISGAFNLLLSGGNLDLSKQIWEDTTEGPYFIDPALAKKAVGERPELLEKK